MSHYDVFIFNGGQWVFASGNRRMTKSAAEGLFAQFAAKYSARLFKGVRIGKMVKEHIREEDRPHLPDHPNSLPNVGGLAVVYE